MPNKLNLWHTESKAAFGIPTHSRAYKASDVCWNSLYNCICCFFQRFLHHQIHFRLKIKKLVQYAFDVWWRCCRTDPKSQPYQIFMQIVHVDARLSVIGWGNIGGFCILYDRLFYRKYMDQRYLAFRLYWNTPIKYILYVWRICWWSKLWNCKIYSILLFNPCSIIHSLWNQSFSWRLKR